MSLQERLVERKRLGFISVKVLEELITPSSVQQLLSQDASVPVHQVDQDYVVKALPRARKLIAVLVLTGLEQHILEIISERRMTDDIFPIDNWWTFPSLAAEDAKCVYSEQWTIPPVLKRGKHLQFPEGVILPFLSKRCVSYGSFGIVYRVEIADGHLDSQVLGSAKVRTVSRASVSLI